METHLKGNILHQDEWSRSTTPREFHLLSVLLRNLPVHRMSSLLIVHVPPFIHSCTTLSFEVQIQNRLLHSNLNTPVHHPQAFQDILRTSRTLKTSRRETNTCCPSARSLEPSPMKGNLGCCSYARN